MEVPEKIDFSYSSDIDEVFGPETEEYKLLEGLGEGDWENYLDGMAAGGITVEYDSVDDQFIVQGHNRDDKEIEGSKKKTSDKRKSVNYESIKRFLIDDLGINEEEVNTMSNSELASYEDEVEDYYTFHGEEVEAGKKKVISLKIGDKIVVTEDILPNYDADPNMTDAEREEIENHFGQEAMVTELSSLGEEGYNHYDLEFDDGYKLEDCSLVLDYDDDKKELSAIKKITSSKETDSIRFNTNHEFRKLFN